MQTNPRLFLHFVCGLGVSPTIGNQDLHLDVLARPLHCIASSVHLHRRAENGNLHARLFQSFSEFSRPASA